MRLNQEIIALTRDSSTLQRKDFKNPERLTQNELD